MIWGGAGPTPAGAQSTPAADLQAIRAKAENQDPEALNALGNAYTSALLGLKQDFNEAAKWYRLAADKGYAPAQFNLGLASELGRGMPADDRQAFKYYLMAAEQGFAAAQFNVGNMYSAGRGVGKDLFEANLWYKQAAEKGVLEAQFNLGLAYEAGRGVKKDEAQAARWYKQAADRGFVRAQYNLGLLLEDGRGVPKNENAAAAYYRAAAEQDFPSAQNNYGVMMSEGRGGLTKDPVQALFWLSLAAQNGSSPAARDFVAKSLSSGQRAAANQLLADHQAGKGWPTSGGSGALIAASSPTGSGALAASAREQELAAALEQARQANSRLAESNQRLELEKAQLAQELSQSGASANQIEPLREQSRRLVAELQTLTAAKDAAEKTAEALAQKVDIAHEQLAQQKAAAAAAPAVDGAKLQGEISTLSARLELATDSTEKLKEANRQLGETLSRTQKELDQLKTAAQSVPTVAAATGVDAGKYEQEIAALNGKLADSAGTLEQLKQTNQQLTEAAARAEQDKVRIAANAERATAALAQQVQDAQQELTRQKALAAAAPPVDASNYDRQIAALTAQLAQASGSLEQLKLSNQQLAATASRVQKENEALTAAAKEAPSGPTPGKYTASGSDKDAILANLQRDNARLNDEVKRSTRELLSLNQQLRTLRNQSGKTPSATVAGAGENAASAEMRTENQRVDTNNTRLQGQRDVAVSDAENLVRQLGEARSEITRLNEQIQQLRSTRQSTDAASDQLGQLTSKVALATQEAERLQAENSHLAARVAELEKVGRAGPDTTSLAPELAQTKQQLQALQADQAGLAKLVEEKSKAVQTGRAELDALQQKLALSEQQVADQATARKSQEQMVQQLTAENHNLADRARQAEEALAAQKAQPAVDQMGPLKQQLAEMRDQSENLIRENQSLAAKAAKEHTEAVQAQARVAALEGDLREAQKKSAGRGTGQDDLKKQLAEANQALVKSNANVNELQAAAAVTAQELAAAQARLAALETELSQAPKKSTDQLAGQDEWKLQLAAAERAQQESAARVTELTAANEKLENSLQAAAQRGDAADALRAELAKLQRETADLASERETSSRLSKVAEEAAALRLKAEQLVQANADLTGSLNGLRSELAQSQNRAAELEKQLEEARTIRTRGGDDSKKLQGDLADANQSVEKLTATVADLTAVNDRLEKDLENERKSTAAALAAQDQAVTAARPDAYQMEISTLQAHIKEVEGQMEVERSNTAKEIATMAAQLQRTRDTNKALTDANRALVNAKQSEQPTVDKDQYDQLQAKVGNLTSAADEARRQNRKLTEDVQRITGEREALKQQLDDAHKVASVMPGLADEKAALQERLEAVGTQLGKTQQEMEALQKQFSEVTAQAAASKQAADKAQADLLALQTRAAEAEKASESHGATAAELTQINAKLETEREDMRRLVESYRADINRLTASVRTAEQQRVDANRGAQQNIDALSAQLGQLRRDLESARTAQSRIVEANTAQERERVATIAQLRTENAALAARLNQAQGTLDQIAAAARLGTPASTIATGGTVPLRPVTAPATQVPEARYHTVVEGDSLSRISMRYYGTSNRWQEIFNANRDVLQGSSTLRVGMQLRIP